MICSMYMIINIAPIIINTLALYSYKRNILCITLLVISYVRYSSIYAI